MCDGMGGHDGGKLASGMAVSQMLEIYNQNYPSNSIFDMLLDAADLIDNKISGLCREDGTAMRSGSTLISAVI